MHIWEITVHSFFFSVPFEFLLVKNRFISIGYHLLLTLTASFTNAFFNSVCADTHTDVHKSDYTHINLWIAGCFILITFICTHTHTCTQNLITHTHTHNDLCIDGCFILITFICTHTRIHKIWSCTHIYKCDYTHTDI